MCARVAYSSAARGRSSSSLEATLLSLRPMIGRPNLVAISAGGAFFWLACFLVIPILIHTVNASLLYAAFIASGVIVGVLARQFPLMHGLLLGVLTGILLASFPVLFQDAPMPSGSSPLSATAIHIALSALPGLIFCPLGALLGDGIAHVKRGL